MRVNLAFTFAYTKNSQFSTYASGVCTRQLNINWHGVKLAYCSNQLYLGVTLDRTLSFKAHIKIPKGKLVPKTTSSVNSELKVWKKSNDNQNYTVCMPFMKAFNSREETEPDSE